MFEMKETENRFFFVNHAGVKVNSLQFEPNFPFQKKQKKMSQQPTEVQTIYMKKEKANFHCSLKKEEKRSFVNEPQKQSML